jgi:Dolichyl-phosphate-mannose-protein mannosyltransferase
MDAAPLEGSVEGASGTPLPGSATRGRSQLWAVTAIMGIGVLLRSVQYFGRPSMWFDELAVALNIQRHALGELVSRPLDFFQVAPAGFLALVKLSTGPLGVNELGLRLVPWLSSLAALVLFWRVATRFLAGAPLLVGLLLFGVSPALVWYGNNVKPYAGDVAFTLLLVLLGLRLRERPGDVRGALVSGLVGGLSLLLSFPAVVTAAVVGAILTVDWLRSHPRKPFVPLVALAVPWGIAAAAAVGLAQRLRAADADVYMRRFWAQDFLPAPWHGLDALLWLPERLFSILGFQLLFIAREWSFGQVFVSLCAVLACAGVVDAFRRSPVQAGLLLAPTLAAILASSARLLPFGLRVSLYAGWPLQLAVVIGLQWLASAFPRRRRLALGLASTVAAIPAVLVAVFHPPYHHQETRPVLAALARQWRPGDRLYVYPGAGYAVDFYGAPLGLTGGIVGGCHREDPRAYFREIDPLRGAARVWFVYSHSARGFREPEVIRSYLETIGRERAHIPDPYGLTGQSEAAAYLYDLSEPARLAAANWETHRFPDPFTDGPRDFCDGTRIGR